MRVAAGVGGRERRARPVVERMAAREWRGWPGGVFRHSGGARWLVLVRSAAVWGRHGWRPPVCSAEARRVRRAGESSKRLKALQPRAAFAGLMLLPESSAGHRAGRHGPVDAQYLTQVPRTKTPLLSFLARHATAQTAISCNFGPFWPALKSSSGSPDNDVVPPLGGIIPF